ncbi:unnamed protein product [Knipowitschia caucasica]
MGTQQTHKHVLKTSGVNVCGGQCCHGWSATQGSNRCITPNCFPRCQNGGMCLRPQLCVCKPGSQGQSCQVQTQDQGPDQTRNQDPDQTQVHSNKVQTEVQTPVVPQRPIPQQVLPHGLVQSQTQVQTQVQTRVQTRVQTGSGPMKISMKPQYVQHQIRSTPMFPGQFLLKPKYYHSSPSSPSHTPGLPSGHPDRAIPLSVAPHYGGNQSGRIKVVFTPTICKMSCVGGACRNTCRQGNTTTIISQNGHATDTLTAPNFRVVVCHLPCMNGGKCSSRDKCQCPVSFTGKFCQLPSHTGDQVQYQRGTTGGAGGQVHSTHTLPLSYNGHTPVQNPSLVNVHIKHPPEASVQVHQVSQLDHYSHTPSSHGHAPSYPGSSHSYSYSYKVPVSKNSLGRCFQETTGTQCGKLLPGLSKQEQCCNSIGTSWGFHQCSQCPNKPSIPLIECPPGYRRINTSHCHDVDECRVPGICPHGACVNSVGSFRCSCDLGFMSDPSLTLCLPGRPAPPVPLPVAPQEKGPCFRLLGAGRQCLHPVPSPLSQALCCCSVGKAWGPQCERCPSPGTAKFKEICPGGMGYTVLPNPAHRPMDPQEPVQRPEPPVPLPTPERPVEAFGFSEDPRPEVIEKTSPPAPVEILPTNAGQDLAPTQSADVDECLISPFLCGPGVCYNTVQGFSCHCPQGYEEEEESRSCTDVDECLQDPLLCSGGRCTNTEGSFWCQCPSGFTVDQDGTSCVDVDECQDRTICASGICSNSPGSFSCGSCPPGYEARGGGCADVDECADSSVCTRGHCVNTDGSFSCDCGPGFRLSPTGHQCDDVDECVSAPGPCGSVGDCVNSVGSYSCLCTSGFREGLDQRNQTSCTDVDECSDPDLCSPHGDCMNTDGSYVCVCDSGFTPSSHPSTCEDIDECSLNDTLCGPHGFCENRVGSYRCLCDQGYQEGPHGHSCTDVDECSLLASVCGAAVCLNVEGSFTCVCPAGQMYNVMIAQCEPAPTVTSVQRKECYFRLNEETLCESVLTSAVTLAECCCTLGAGWGDNCEVHPCPVNGTDQFEQMCPSGRGYVPVGDSLYGVQTRTVYRDADECVLFGQEVCKGGFCQNTEGNFECYCKSGQDYDPELLECRDIDECEDEAFCSGGQCLNTDGSFMCFCTLPLIWDQTQNTCVLLSDNSDGESEEEFQGVCWQVVTEGICSEPLGPDRRTTFTECCCLYGGGWGPDCALCPPPHSEDYAQMCNLPLSRRAFGRDALEATVYYDYDQPAAASEALQSDECGVLNGCENGRCVRVQEGFTCRCYGGFRLELHRMVCVDEDECAEAVCTNARCVNTLGSFHCECLPGFRPAAPHQCVKEKEYQERLHQERPHQEGLHQERPHQERPHQQRAQRHRHRAAAH